MIPELLPLCSELTTRSTERRVKRGGSCLAVPQQLSYLMGIQRRGKKGGEERGRMKITMGLLLAPKKSLSLKIYTISFHHFPPTNMYLRPKPSWCWPTPLSPCKPKTNADRDKTLCCVNIVFMLTFSKDLKKKKGFRLVRTSSYLISDRSTSLYLGLCWAQSLFSGEYETNNTQLESDRTSMRVGFEEK